MSVKLLAIPMIGAALLKGCIKASETALPKVAPKVASAGVRYYYRHQNDANSTVSMEDTYIAEDFSVPQVPENNADQDMKELAAKICSEDNKMGHELSVMQDIMIEKYRTRKIEKEELLSTENSLENVLDKAIKEILNKKEIPAKEINSLTAHCKRYLSKQFNAKLAKIQRIEIPVSIESEVTSSDSLPGPSTNQNIETSSIDDPGL